MLSHRHFGFFILLGLALLWSNSAYSQSNTTNDTPLNAVRLFKANLDRDSITSVCELMAEEDASGPLQRIHFEKMQNSLREIINLWRGVQFSYGVTEINSSKQPFRASMTVSVPKLKQEVSFTLLKFETGWYISDIEIFFK